MTGRDAVTRQDAAAGSRRRRCVTLTTGETVRASVQFKYLKKRRYAYLRASVPRSTRTAAVYLGKAPDADDEDGRLRLAWDRVDTAALRRLAERLELLAKQAPRER